MCDITLYVYNITLLMSVDVLTDVDASFTSSCQRLPTTFSSSHPLFYHVYDNHAQHTNSKVSSMRRMCSSVPGGGGVASDTGTGGGGGGRELAGSHGSTKQLMVSDSIVSASKRLTVRSVLTLRPCPVCCAPSCLLCCPFSTSAECFSLYGCREKDS